MKNLTQIAKELNVSNATVSYVYNDKWREKRISESLAEKIKSKLKAENFKPNQLGKQLRLGKTMTIGVVMPNLYTIHSLELLRGIEIELSKHGYLTLLCNSNYGQNEKALLDILPSRNVDGAIVAPYNYETYTKDNHKSSFLNDIPLIFIDNYIPETGVDFVVSDNKKAAFDVVNLCVEKGCERIAYMGGRSLKAQAAKDRFDGYLMALEKAGLSSESLIHRDVAFDQNLKSTLDSMFSHEPVPDALFIESFLFFEEGFKFLFEKNINVPDEINLVGFDDPTDVIKKFPTDMKSFFRAPFPYVAQDAEFIGRTAAKRLFEIMSEKSQKSLRIFADAAIIQE